MLEHILYTLYFSLLSNTSHNFTFTNLLLLFVFQNFKLLLLNIFSFPACLRRLKESKLWSTYCGVVVCLAIPCRVTAKSSFSCTIFAWLGLRIVRLSIRCATIIADWKQLSRRTRRISSNLTYEWLLIWQLSIKWFNRRGSILLLAWLYCLKKA